MFIFEDLCFNFQGLKFNFSFVVYLEKVIFVVVLKNKISNDNYGTKTYFDVFLRIAPYSYQIYMKNNS